MMRVVIGLVFMGHGAQKLFGVWGGPGLKGWTAGTYSVDHAMSL